MSTPATRRMTQATQRGAAAPQVPAVEFDLGTLSSGTGNDFRDADMKDLLNSLPRGKEWNLSNYTTILNWLNMANLNNLLLDFTIAHYRGIVNRVTVITLIVSSVASTISLLQFSNSTDTIGYFVVQIITVILSFITSILAGYLKITRMNDLLEEAQARHQAVIEFITELSIQLQLPINIRTNALKLIMSRQKDSKTLLASEINIPKSVKKTVSNMLRRDDDRGRMFQKLIQEEAQQNHATSSAPSSTGPRLDRQGSLIDEQLLSGIMTTTTTSSSSTTAPNAPTSSGGGGGGTLTSPLDGGGSLFFANDPVKPLTTKKAKQKYIYDADRLHFYFLIKDIILNELSMLTRNLHATNMIEQTEYISYSVLPTRIFLKKKTTDFALAQPLLPMNDKDNTSSPPLALPRVNKDSGMMPQHEQQKLNDTTILLIDGVTTHSMGSMESEETLML
jgi:hypothetical protein